MRLVRAQELLASVLEWHGDARGVSAATPRKGCEMSLQNLCPICLLDGVEPLSVQSFTYYYECPRCGRFSVNHDFVLAYQRSEATADWRWQLSSAVRAATDRSGKLSDTIVSDNYKQLIELAAKPSDALENADFLIAAIAERTDSLGSATRPEDAKSILAWVARSWVKSFEHLQALVRELQGLSLLLFNSHVLKPQEPSYSFVLKPEGWRRAIELRRRHGPGNQAFVAMWFHPQLDVLYKEGIKLGLLEVGYNPYRVDGDPRPEMIDNKIIAGIRSSSLLIADCTGARQSVYFEAGLAMGLGIEVVWCCNHLKRSVPDGEVRLEVPTHDQGLDWFDVVSFDTRQYPHILWSTPGDLREQIVDMVRARGLALTH